MSDNIHLCHRLPQAFAIEVSGSDALKVVNNLSTNDLVDLREQGCCESFITNLKGWTVAHVLVWKMPDRLLLVGQHPSPSLICEHIDRYIIREDAQVSDVTNGKSLLVVQTEDVVLPLPNGSGRLPIGLLDAELLVCEKQDEARILADLGRDERRGEVSLGSNEDFERLRVRSFWPRKGIEIGEKTIPQELDRDSRAISFTKGCYLGQETIARLDARGQLQKKLCLLKFASGCEIAAGSELYLRTDSDPVEVGSVTSVGRAADCTWAMGFLKRKAYEVGSSIGCQDQSGEVVAPTWTN